MKKYKTMVYLITLSLSILLIFSISVSAENETLESKVKDEVVRTDEMDGVFEHYFAIRELLSKDEVEKVEFHSKEISARLDRLIDALESIKVSSSALKASNLDEARKGFGSLSKSMLSYLKQFGYSDEVYVFHCPMAKGGDWLQETDQIGNPYYGSKMYKCGEMTGMTVNGKFVDEVQGSSSTRIYQIFGMDCPGCHGAIEKLVTKIPAVQKAEANWKEQLLVLTLRPGVELNDEDVYDAIRSANFTPGERIK